MARRKNTWEITLRVQHHSDEPERLSQTYLPSDRAKRRVPVRALLWFLGATAAGLLGYLIQQLLG
jgi:hypothetical protein